jgi:hypothetical protein
LLRAASNVIEKPARSGGDVALQEGEAQAGTHALPSHSHVSP